MLPPPESDNSDIFSYLKLNNHSWSFSQTENKKETCTMRVSYSTAQRPLTIKVKVSIWKLKIKFSHPFLACFYPDTSEEFSVFHHSNMSSCSSQSFLTISCHLVVTCILSLTNSIIPFGTSITQLAEEWSGLSMIKDHKVSANS